MYPRVTAVVVARNGGEHLRRTLDALAAQTRPVDALVAVDCESTDDTATVFTVHGAERIVSVGRRTCFGAAIAAAVSLTPPPDGENEWLWLLAQDTAPLPGALEALLAAVETSPSVATAGPKQVHWDDTHRLGEFGQTMTKLGATVPLVEDELDQAQHDRLSDVLGVSPAGMLVRHSVWLQLAGFDPALPTVDDGLDFCVRVRLAGHRVVLVPDARVAVAGDGIVGLPRSRRTSVARKAWRARRAAQLHRRMVYAPALAVPVHWLSLIPLAVIRSLWRLLRKQPAAIGGELLAALLTAFGGRRVPRARRTLSRAKRVGWAAIDPLRMPQPEVRRARALRRETMGAKPAPKHPLTFFSGGGAWVVLALAVLGVALFSPLLGSTAMSGGSFLPLSGLGELWRNALYGWHDAGGGFVGAADPFALLLALLGSLTFWQPSFVLVLLVIAALPLAGLGAWFAAARLTPHAGLRAFFALAWALAPPLFAALQSGRPAAVLAHLLLPWLVFAALAARRSWAAAASAALLAAAVTACAPSLVPALAVVWLVGLALAGRRLARIAWIPVPALALFAPLAWQQASRGTPFAVFADPGVPVMGEPTVAWQLALGFPSGISQWDALARLLALPPLAPGVAVAVLLAPLALLAVAALLARRPMPAIGCLVLAVLGLATAVAASHIALAARGAHTVTLWPGAGLSLYWFGIAGAATFALATVKRASAVIASVAVIALAVAVAPIATALPRGHSGIGGGDATRFPALVIAEATANPRVGTLLLTPQDTGGVRAQLVRGAGETLDGQSTFESTRRQLNDADARLSRLAANLASQSGLDTARELAELGVGFIVIPDDGAGARARHEGARAAAALDANPALVSVGSTTLGGLWSFAAGAESAPDIAALPPAPGGAVRGWVLGIQALLIAVTLLLAIPTGRVEHAPAPRRRGGKRRARASGIDGGRASGGFRRAQPSDGDDGRASGGFRRAQPSDGDDEVTVIETSAENEPEASGENEPETMPEHEPETMSENEADASGSDSKETAHAH